MSEQFLQKQKIVEELKIESEDLQQKEKELVSLIQTFESTEICKQYVQMFEEKRELTTRKNQLVDLIYKAEITAKLASKCDLTTKFKLVVVDRFRPQHHPERESGIREMTVGEIYELLKKTDFVVTGGGGTLNGYRYGVKPPKDETFPTDLLSAFTEMDIKSGDWRDWKDEGRLFVYGICSFRGN